MIKDKETEWLNGLANEGWAMKGFFAGFYSFEPCEKGEYTYQIDFSNKACSVSKDYRDFMDEADIEIVQTWFFWVFLRKKKAYGDFELYTDVDSQIEHYKKILKMFKTVTILELFCLFYDVFAAVYTGNVVIWGAVLFLLAVVLAFVKITVHTCNVIHQLQERKTGIEEPRNRNVSGLLIAGLFINSFAILARDSISENIALPIQIFAVVLMLIGLFQTGRKQK